MPDLSQHESFSEFRRPGSPFLQPSSSSFGGLERATIRSTFVATARRLRRELLLLNDALAAGDVTIQGFVVRATTAVRTAYFVTYSLGAISIFPFYTLTDRDIMILDEELSTETGFLRELASDIHSHHLVLDPTSRAGLYLFALRGIFERGRVEAMPGGPYRWRLGNSEHCENCLTAALSGPYQRSRNSGLGLSILPGSPGDGSVCLGLTRCGCRIELDSGIPLPNEDLSDELRGLLMEIAHGFSPST